MSGVDVRDLASQPLEGGDFPVSLQSDFRLHFRPAARDKMLSHAGADAAIEICGVLVGRLLKDGDGPYVVVEDCVCCDTATSKFAEVTFTHESWSQINQEMDTKFTDKQIVGWYHSHPNFGVFLSDRDRFIHEHFFSGPGQVAYVIDPVRNEEGVFIWRNGTTAALPHYWVGDSIRLTQLHEYSVRRPETEQENPPAGRPSTAEAAWFTGLVPLLLLSALAFLLGHTSSRLQTSWERQRVVDGVVAHYGVNKLVKLGLQESLAVVSNRLKEIASASERLAKAARDTDASSNDETLKAQRQIERGFRDCIDALQQIGDRFGYDEFERRALAVYLAEKQAGVGAPSTTPAPTKSLPPPPAAPDQAPTVGEPASNAPQEDGE
ncbi:Mov34/MPN/PAD-1 family protein [Botrimarina mediterranea]|uniref:Mov34/MPN/PAD-1 family protein n=1 Tax=Botrimarina mediterranea TaxID=2528022 RepID=UPI00118BEB6E|nr:Mov34/MPN/PAD-1 family protein [Planctomycetes bacterium K2D]